METNDKLKRPSLKYRLTEPFYDRPTTIVARELLGKALMRRIDGDWIGGTIVETEAYLPEDDPACHASRGMTPSNASMFGPPGTLYVYPIHAKHCMNAVTEAAGKGSAVLIRAIQPLWGVATMKTNRGHQELRRLTSGPGMLCQALQIDRRCDGISLTGDRNMIIAETDSKDKIEILATERIGISKAKADLLRFVIVGNRFVSGKVH